MARSTGFLTAAICLSAFVAGARAALLQPSLQTLLEETRIGAVLQRLQTSAPQGPVAFSNVRIVEPGTGVIEAGQAVIASRGARGRIVWVGKAADLPRRDDMTVIDGGGRFLAPGLTDMHVHSSSLSEWLLDLDKGITTVRDMDGFPWLLQARQSVNAERMLAPTIYVAATIINAYPMWGYAVVPANPADARRIVRQQAACGYDFIKIHNILPRAMFDAVIEQANALDMDVVGHVPHDLDLSHALHQMRTTEHLKGFIIDQTLLPSETDFAEALAGAETWITPTLYTRTGYLRGNEARAILRGPEARYVSPQTRAQWRKLLGGKPDPRNNKLGARLRSSQNEVMKRLLPLQPRWLAGTDAAGYPFNVMGFALIEELRLLQSEGVSPTAALQAATTEPAHAMREEAEFGAIKVGMRADLVLLDKNPLDDPAVYGANAGVMVRGLWLARDKLDATMNDLAAIYANHAAQETVAEPSENNVVAMAESLSRSGYVIPAPILQAAASALEEEEETHLAARLAALAPKAGQPPCAIETPTE